jgi:uncharacterized protein (DUF1778 family)
MSPRTGRPPSDNPRTEILRIRLAANELAVIVAAAEQAGQTIADWARTELDAAAKRRIRRRRGITPPRPPR